MTDKHSRKPTAEEYATRVQQQLGNAWLPQIYQRVRSKRTRAYQFASVKPGARIEIQHTLLGVELKTGGRRLLCPDLATARYLAVFARAGCKEVAVPYDITKISQVADELESSWYRMLLLADEHSSDEAGRIRSRVRKLLIHRIQTEIAAAGAGSASPEFKQSTKQRR